MCGITSPWVRHSAEKLTWNRGLVRAEHRTLRNKFLHINEKIHLRIRIFNNPLFADMKRNFNQGINVALKTFHRAFFKTIYLGAERILKPGATLLCLWGMKATDYANDCCLWKKSCRNIFITVVGPSFLSFESKDDNLICIESYFCSILTPWGLATMHETKETPLLALFCCFPSYPLNIVLSLEGLQIRQTE